MAQPSGVLARYVNGEYRASNPQWDNTDAPWKARILMHLLGKHAIVPRRIVDVGCGAGGVLAELRDAYPDACLEGYDIAPDCRRFWPQYERSGISFTLGDFLIDSDRRYDLILALDVLEHLADPFHFLANLRARGEHFAFHFPLDLSANSVLRETPLLGVRRKVGHIHYFTKGLALALLEENGYRIVEAQYTGASYSSPQRGLRTRLAAIPRRIGYLIARDLSVRLLGGETLMVIARAEP